MWLCIASINIKVPTCSWSPLNSSEHVSMGSWATNCKTFLTWMPPGGCHPLRPPHASHHLQVTPEVVPECHLVPRALPQQSAPQILWSQIERWGIDGNPKREQKKWRRKVCWERGGQESGRCHRNHHSFADNQSQGKYRYKINALNTVSYYIWFFRKRKKKIFCGTFSLTLLRERGMLFDIGICRYMHLLYKVEKISGGGNRWLGLQPERFFLEALVVGGWSVRLWAVILYSGQCAGQARCTS